MVPCDRSRMQLKIDVSDVTAGGSEAAVQQRRLFNVSVYAPAVVLQLWVDLSCALRGKQMLGPVLLFIGVCVKSCFIKE